MTIIMRSSSFTLDNQFNGLCYCLTHIPSGKDIFLQGDDATQFREELDALELARPEALAEEILGELFNQYNEVTQ